MRTKAERLSRAQLVVVHTNADLVSEPKPTPTGGSMLPMFCPMCHDAVMLQFVSGWLEENLKQAWACPYCCATNVDGFPYRLAWVAKDYGFQAKTASADETGVQSRP
jgi:hypothetical protein